MSRRRASAGPRWVRPHGGRPAECHSLHSGSLLFECVMPSSIRVSASGGELFYRADNPGALPLRLDPEEPSRAIDFYYPVRSNIAHAARRSSRWRCVRATRASIRMLVVTPVIPSATSRGSALWMPNRVRISVHVPESFRLVALPGTPSTRTARPGARRCPSARRRGRRSRRLIGGDERSPSRGLASPHRRSEPPEPDRGSHRARRLGHDRRRDVQRDRGERRHAARRAQAGRDHRPGAVRACQRAARLPKAATAPIASGACDARRAQRRAQAPPRRTADRHQRRRQEVLGRRRHRRPRAPHRSRPPPPTASRRATCPPQRTNCDERVRDSRRRSGRRAPRCGLVVAKTDHSHRRLVPDCEHRSGAPPATRCHVRPAPRQARAGAPVRMFTGAGVR
jgi:hypothetical protein